MIVKSKLCWGILATGMASLAICLAACNDTITESKGVESVATFEKLGDCTKDKDGEMMFVADSAMLYYCYEEEWVRVKGLDGETGEKGEKVTTATRATMEARATTVLMASRPTNRLLQPVSQEQKKNGSLR